MKRLQLFEIHDQSWCPASLRDTLTAFIPFVTRVGGLYEPAVPLLRRALERAGTRRVVDLCSGSGGPWSHLVGRLSSERGGLPLDVSLTDKFPNAAARDRPPAGVRYYPGAVDATAVPRELPGFRTLFTSFHHFPPDAARAILADAVRQSQGIAIFEVTHRSLLGIAGICLTPIGIPLVMPFVRPFRWAHLLWTYVVPVFPLMEAFDGIVSCLRTYSLDELRDLTRGLGDGRYAWEIGQARARWAPVPMTYCIGYPTASASPAPAP